MAVEEGNRSTVTTPMSAITEISRAIVGPIDLQQLLDSVVGTLAELSRAQTCSIWLIDPDGKLRIKAAKGYHERLLRTCPDYREAERDGRLQEYAHALPIPAEYDLGEGATGTIAQTGVPLVTTGKKRLRDAPDAQWQGRYDRVQWPDGGECISYFGAPLKVRDHVTGVLKIENKKEPSGGLAQEFNKEDGEVLTILANVIAVTIENQRLAEEREKQALETWRTVSARLAHKIGNQNFAATGLLGSLKQAGISTEARDLADHIQECSEAIGLTVGEAKRFSSPPAISRTSCRLADIVESAAMAFPVGEWVAELTFQHQDAEGLILEVDEGEIRHVTMELLENSEGFKKKGAEVVIRTGRASDEMAAKHRLQGDHAYIDYQDNGPGVPENEKEAIFEPFFSLRQGSGLGLSIVRQIIDAHGGKIVECGAKDMGARFLIFLPIAAPRE